MIHVLPQEHIILSSTEIGVLVNKIGQPVAGVVDLTGRVAVSGAMGGPYFLLVTKPAGHSKEYSLDIHYNGLEQQLVQSIALCEKGVPVICWEELQAESSEYGSFQNSRINGSLFGRGSMGGTPSDEASEAIFVGVSWPTNRIYQIEATPYNDQVSHLINQQEIEEAEYLLTATTKHIEGVERERLMKDFHARACTTLFLNFHFQSVLAHAEKCTMDPKEFLQMFPELYPASLPPSAFVPKYITPDLINAVANNSNASDMRSLASSKYESEKSLQRLGRGDEVSVEKIVENAKICSRRA